jgi:hypothetical protein
VAINSPAKRISRFQKKTVGAAGVTRQPPTELLPQDEGRRATPFYAVLQRVKESYLSTSSASYIMRYIF